MALLELDSLTVTYGSIMAVREVSITVEAGQIYGLIGPNGAGKTTTLGAVAGLLRARSGTIRFDGHDVTNTSPEAMLRRGLALVPEHRRIFTALTVEENLLVGGAVVGARRRHALLDEMAERFDILRDKWRVPAGLLSGGQAQQLAIARALMSEPTMVLMDEPSLGLAPALVATVFELIQDLRSQGRTLLVVEQNATQLLGFADHASVMRTGSVVLADTAAALATHDDLFASYVGNPQ